MLFACPVVVCNRGLRKQEGETGHLRLQNEEAIDEWLSV